MCARAGLAASLAAVAGGCAAPPEAPSFQARTPKARARAVAMAAAERDASAIPDLIQALDDSDPVVRSWAIRALEEITGQRLGYDPNAPQAVRDDAVDRWVSWRLAERQPDTVTGAGGSGSGPSSAETPR